MHLVVNGRQYTVRLIPWLALANLTAGWPELSGGDSPLLYRYSTFPLQQFAGQPRVSAPYRTGLALKVRTVEKNQEAGTNCTVRKLCFTSSQPHTSRLPHLLGHVSPAATDAICIGCDNGKFLDTLSL